VSELRDRCGSAERPWSVRYLSDFDETVPGGGKTCYRLSDIADGLTVARESLKVLRYLQRIL